MEEILNNDFCKVYYDKTSNSIITIWKKPTTSESFRAVYFFLLKKIKEYHADSFISDIFCQGLVPTENRLWLQTEIIPKAYASGLRKVAIIAPHDVFSRFYIESVKNGSESVASEFDMRYFNDLLSAQSWLKNQCVAV